MENNVEELKVEEVVVDEQPKTKITFSEEQQSKIEEIKSEVIKETSDKAVKEFLETKGLSQDDIDKILEERENQKSEAEKTNEELLNLREKVSAYETAELTKKQEKIIMGKIEDATKPDKVVKLIKSLYDVKLDSPEEVIDEAIKGIKEEFPELFKIAPDSTSNIEKPSDEVKKPNRHSIFTNRGTL